MMNAGEFDCRIQILQLADMGGNAFEWRVKKNAWAKKEQVAANSMFSKYGITARSVKFTIHNDPDLSLHNAIAKAPPGTGHYFITDINRETPGYNILSTAFIWPSKCTVTRTKTLTDDKNRPVIEKLPPLIFPGYLTEKYLKQEQQEPMSYSEGRFVLVTPKVIEIQTGELITIGGAEYEMVIPHVLDPYKNEYEILRRADN